VLYFGVSPSASESIVKNFREVRLPPQSRVMLEKPFGQNVKSAQALNRNRKLLELFQEQDVFCVDQPLSSLTESELRNRKPDLLRDVRSLSKNEIERYTMRGPFVLRTGKVMKQDRQELTIFFKPSRYSIFGSSHAVKSNQFRLGLKVDEVGLTINLNGPGNPLEADPV
jgi:glucose-6-phosphate 1-dehydrogenase